MVSKTDQTGTWSLAAATNIYSNSSSFFFSDYICVDSLMPCTQIRQ